LHNAGSSRPQGLQEELAMTLTVAGWVECKNCPEGHLSYGEWAPVVDLEPLLHDENGIRGQAPFTDRLVEGSGQIGPGHGLPDDVSALVAKDAARYNVVYDATFLTWSEMERVRGREDLTDDWRLVLKMVDPLAAVVGKDNVRIILWGYVTDYGVTEQ
jgi:hypothetical protein